MKQVRLLQSSLTAVLAVSQILIGMIARADSPVAASSQTEAALAALQLAPEGSPVLYSASTESSALLSPTPTLVVASSALSALAMGGTSSGGGDPRVAEALMIAKNVCAWFGKQPEYSSYAAACEAQVQDLTSSVNDLSRTPRISFITEEVTDSNGIEKDLVTNLKPNTVGGRRFAAGTIVGNVSRWDQDTQLERKATVTMELCLLLSIPDRYSVAQSFMQSDMSGKTLFSSDHPTDGGSPLTYPSEEKALFECSLFISEQPAPSGTGSGQQNPMTCSARQLGDGSYVFDVNSN